MSSPRRLADSVVYTYKKTSNTHKYSELTRAMERRVWSESFSHIKLKLAN